MVALCNMPSATQASSVSIDNVRNLENLGIIDNGRQCTLEKNLNHCETQAGKIYFQESLCTFSCNRETLEKRQAALMGLVDSSEATKKMKHFLKNCGMQDSALSIFDSQHTILDEFYFKQKPLKRLNSNKAALNSSFFLHYVHLLAPFIEQCMLYKRSK